MGNSNYLTIITKNGKYPLCSKGDKIVLFTAQQVATAFETHLADIRGKLLIKATEFSTLPGGDNSSGRPTNEYKKAASQSTNEKNKMLSQSKNTKFIILDITDTNNISIVTEKKTLFKDNPKTMKFGLSTDALNFVKKLSKRDNTKRYYITHYSQDINNLPF